MIGCAAVHSEKMLDFRGTKEAVIAAALSVVGVQRVCLWADNEHVGLFWFAVDAFSDAGVKAIEAAVLEAITALTPVGARFMLEQITCLGPLGEMPLPAVYHLHHNH